MDIFVFFIVVDRKKFAPAITITIKIKKNRQLRLWLGNQGGNRLRNRHDCTSLH